MKFLQQTPQQQGPGAGSSGWSGAPSSGLTKTGKSPALALLEMQQEAERILKQQHRAQQQRDRVSQPPPQPAARADTHTHRRETGFSPLSLPALWLVDGELLPGEPVERRRRHVGWAWRHGWEGSRRRLLQQHGNVGRGREEPGQPPWQLQQQHGLEEQP